MSTKNIITLINQLIEDDFTSEKEKIKLSSKIKRLYNIEKHELKCEGKEFSFQTLNRIIKILINNYDKLKDK